MKKSEIKMCWFPPWFCFCSSCEKFLKKLTFWVIWSAAFRWFICLWAAAARLSCAVTAELNATGLRPDARSDPRAFDRIKSIENWGFWARKFWPSRSSFWIQHFKCHGRDIQKFKLWHLQHYKKITWLIWYKNNYETLF